MQYQPATVDDVPIDHNRMTTTGFVCKACQG